MAFSFVCWKTARPYYTTAIKAQMGPTGELAPLTKKRIWRSKVGREFRGFLFHEVWGYESLQCS
jgi:hypothetical protein